jgi:Flp pilus assembly protein TadG
MLQELNRDERGAVLVLVVAFISIIFGLAALAIDGGNLYVMRDRMQAAADAASLAGVSQLPTVASVQTAAVSYAVKNLPAAEGNGNVLSNSDIVIGHWNTATRVFTPGASPSDAVQVTVRRTTASGNAVPTYFAGLIGFPTVNVIAQAIATGEDTGAGNCRNSGIVSNSRVYFLSNNTLTNGACVYGRHGVDINANNRFEVGTSMGMLDLADFTHGANNDIPPGVLQAYERSASLPAHSGEYVTALRNGAVGSDAWPPYITRTETVSNFPAEPIPGTAYIVTGPATVTMNSYMNNTLNNVLTNMLIISSSTIDIPSDVGLKNVMLAANGKVTLASNGQIGKSDYCANGGGTVQIVTPNDLDIAANRDIYGGQFIVGGAINMASNDFNVGLSIESEGDFNMPSIRGPQINMANTQINGCGRNEHLWFGPSVGPKFRLVN